MNQYTLSMYSLLRKFLSLALLLYTAVAGAQQANNPTLLGKDQLAKIRAYTSLTEALKEPEKVIVLDLSGQHLDSLPSSIGQLKNLQVLKLGWKIKTSTPKRIIRKSRKVGGGIMHFDRLQGKYIDYNHLTKLPSSIKELIQLQEINLGYNNLGDVPFELLELKHLKYINLVGCYGLLKKEDDLKKFKKLLPGDCVLYTDVRL
jgi:Leucine-rich repeat (LRR) protein